MIAADMPSPIFTPAVLQAGPHGELPPWAHPTPSPSPMLRYPSFAPDEDDERRGHADAPPLPDLLWQVCMPFLNDMVHAVARVMEQQLQGQEAQARARGEAGAFKQQRGDSSRRGSGVSDTGTFVSPFNALLNPGATGTRGVAQRATNSNATGVPVPEEEEEDDDDLQDRPKADCGGFDEGSDQDFDSEDGEYDEGPAQVHKDQTHPDAQAKSRTATGSTPLYLEWSSSGGQQLTPTTSPVMPKTTLPSQDFFKPGSPMTRCRMLMAEGLQNLMPHSQVPDQARAAASGEAPGGGPQGDDALGLGEKSQMVCRHWKTKGWCRMEGQCKFLHPEHKRGSGVATPTASRRLTEGASADGLQPMRTDEAAAGKSRAGRRGKRGSGGTRQQPSASPEALTTSPVAAHPSRPYPWQAQGAFSMAAPRPVGPIATYGRVAM